MEFLIIILMFACVAGFIYFRNKIKKLEEKMDDEKIQVVLNDNFEKIQRTSGFSQNIWNRIYGSK